MVRLGDRARQGRRRGQFDRGVPALALLVVGGRQRHVDDLGVVVRDDVAVRERRRRPQDGAVDVSPAVGAAAPRAGGGRQQCVRPTSS